MTSIITSPTIHGTALTPPPLCLPPPDVAYLRMEGVSSCSDVQEVLPGLLSTMIGVYGVLVLLGVVAAVIAILVYRTERHRKFLMQVRGKHYIVTPVLDFLALSRFVRFLANPCPRTASESEVK